MSGLLHIEPVFKQMIWGGSRMRTDFGYAIPGDDTGECWAISAHKNGDCVIASGEYAGQTLSQLWSNHPELFGRTKNDAAVFPLLTKIIDARRDLSIQVHPDDEYAAVHENGALGKTECWYVLDCIPGASIVIGHNARTHEELEDMIHNRCWNDFIREIPISKGDFFQIDPGTVHAIKGGTLILETQQNSDVTYRVYDYDRLQNGSLRPLHIAQSIDVIKVPFDADREPDRTDVLNCSGETSCEPLVRCGYYRVWKVISAGTGACMPAEPFMLCSIIEGSGIIGGDPVKKGDHFIVPAGYGSLAAEGTFQMICSAPCGC